MDCARFHDENLLDDYLAGRLTSDERERVELHYFECQSCFEQLQARMAAGQVLRELPRRSPWRWVSWLAAAAALVACVVLFGPHKRRLRTENPVIAGQPNRSEELARIEPPRYERMVLRGPGSEAGAAFKRAMREYSGGRWREAAESLEGVAKLDPAAPAPKYYLGICLLASGRAEDGARVLEGLIALGDTPYLEGAHFFLAKAHLAANRVSAARTHFEAAARLRGEWEAEARRCLTRIDSPRP